MNLSHGHIYQYNNDFIQKDKFNSAEFIENFHFGRVSELNTTWINFYMLDETNIIEEYLKKHKYDSLVIQMIREHDNRPQFEDYNEYLFFTIKTAVPQNVNNLRIHQEQLSFILGENYLISMQTKPSDHFASVRDRLENKKGIIRDKGSDFLLYRLLDAIVDNYFEVMDNSTTVIEELDSRVNKTSDPQLLTSIELQKRKLMEMRKIVMPLKEIIISLESSKSPLFNEGSKHYYTDLKQNCISILEEIESNKNALDGLTNLYYAVQGQRMNEIMKVLTIVSTIFIPLTFIVGVYGMNFQNMPELRTKNGYFIIWAIMLTIVISLLFYFFKKGWLRKN